MAILDRRFLAGYADLGVIEDSIESNGIQQLVSERLYPPNEARGDATAGVLPNILVAGVPIRLKSRSLSLLKLIGATEEPLTDLPSFVAPPPGAAAAAPMISSSIRLSSSEASTAGAADRAILSRSPSDWRVLDKALSRAKFGPVEVVSPSLDSGATGGRERQEE